MIVNFLESDARAIAPFNTNSMKAIKAGVEIPGK
jgi:hypothetical protein